MKDKPDSILRVYQVEAQQAIVVAWDCGVRSVMLQMPTGAGKTRLFVNIIASRPARYMIVTHREELVEQVSETLTNHYHLGHGILQGKNTKNLERNIIVASIQSWTKNTQLLVDFDCIIIDEAHHSLADSYKKLWECYPDAKTLGVTATPYRLKKAAFTELYDTLIESWPMRRMIKEGYLANYRMFSVSEKKASIRKINRLTKFGTDGDYKIKDLQDIVVVDEEIDFLLECYKQNANEKKGIIYAINQEHAKKIAERFANEGIKAVAIDSKTKAKDRKQHIEDFKQGRIQVLVNVELFTEGFDCPSIEFVMLARPTRSLTMYMQQVGRALRVNPATKSQGNGRSADIKNEVAPVLILDCAGLRHRFGLPDRKRDWQKHFKGERPQTEQYEKNTLGEPGTFPLLREYRREEGKIRLLPEKEILPSETGVHIYHDNKIGKYGLCDSSGDMLTFPRYTEINPTPFGWYIGLNHAFGHFYPTIINKRGTRHMTCTSLLLIDGLTYEARWYDYLLRFNQNMKLIPRLTIEKDGKTAYQVSFNANKLYVNSLNLQDNKKFWD